MHGDLVEYVTRAIVIDASEDDVNAGEFGVVPVKGHRIHGVDLQDRIDLANAAACNQALGSSNICVASGHEPIEVGFLDDVAVQQEQITYPEVCESERGLGARSAKTYDGCL